MSEPEDIFEMASIDLVYNSANHERPRERDVSNPAAKSITPLLLEPGPSRHIRLITLTGLLLALGSLAVVPLSLPVIMAAVLLLGFAAIYAWHHHHALAGKAVSVRLDSKGNWQWQERGNVEKVELLGDSLHVPFLVILNFKPEGRRRSVRSLLLTRDNIEPDTLRRLRVHLNWQQDKSTKP